MENSDKFDPLYLGRYRPRGHALLPLFRPNYFEKTTLPTCIEKALIDREDRKIVATLDRLRKGEVLTTVSRGRLVVGEQPRFCRLDCDLLYFRYSIIRFGCECSFSKKREKKVDLRHIRVHLGVQENYTKNAVSTKSSIYFSIVFNNSQRMPLSFITESENSAMDWVTGLNYLKKQLSNLQPRLQFELAAWELFHSADKHRTGHVTANQARKILLSQGLSATREIISSFAVPKTFFSSRPTLTFQAFLELFQEITSRPEINELFSNISADKMSITVRELYKFIQEHQHEDVTEKECEELILNFEIKDESRMNKQMTYHGFNLYMFSKYCELFDWKHDDVYQDMNQPLSHYFIASSHNTYLTGDQITEPSSVGAYMTVLLKGCRCVELDCWDGPDGEPVITHGYTFTSKISFKDVVEVIGRYAFEESQYPLILSLEIHCSLPQQDKMAFYLKTILGSELLTSPLLPVEDTCALPSPSALRGKILLKGKTLANTKTTDQSVSNEDANDTDSNNLLNESKTIPRSFSLKRSFKRSKSSSSCSSASTVSAPLALLTNWNISPALSKLIVYCKSVKFTSYEDPNLSVVEMASFSEAKGKRMIKTDKDDLVEYHKHKLSRTYPSGTRTDSSNYDPQPFWNAGFQLVALNYQTKCDEMDTNTGKFRQNGNCGYILKPEFQRSPKKTSIDSKYKTPTKLLTISVVSAPKYEGYGKGHNLMVEVVASGETPDNSRQYLSCYRNEGNITGLPDSCTLHLCNPDLVMLRFLLKDRTKMGERMGQYVLPYTSISRGYRHLPFFDNNGAKVNSISLFVHVVIEDICSISPTTKSL